MEKLLQHKHALFACGLVVLLLLSLCVELYGFNGGIMALDKADRVVTELGPEDLSLQNLERDETGHLLLGEGEPGFSVAAPMYIGRLCIATTPETPLMHVSFGDSEHYDVNHRMKEISVLRVMDEAENVDFLLSMDGDDWEISLGGIAVDNTLELNWLRIFAMVSISGTVLFFLVYRDLAGKKLHVSFLVIAIVFGVNLALVTPAWYGYDEGAHFVRAYQFAEFDLGLDDERENRWIEDVDDFFYYTGTANSPHNTYDERQAFMERYNDHEYPHSEHRATTAATYPFVPYFFAGIGILLARLVGFGFAASFYAGRIFNVLGYALVVFFAIKYAKMGKRLLFLLGLVPYALFSAGVYTADTLTVSFAILAIALYMNMLMAEDGSLNWRLPSLFALCVAAMAMCKLPYAPFCLLILSVPMKKFGGKKQAFLHWLLVFALVGGVSLATLLFGADKGIIQWYEPGMSVVGQVKFILTHIPTYIMIMFSHVRDFWTVYLSGSISEMGFTGTLHPVWTWLAVLTALALALLDREEGNKTLTALPKVACLFTAGISWALVLTALYVSFNIVAAPFIRGVQGRYFYPLLLPLLLLLKNSKFNLPIEKEKLNGLCIAVCVVLNIVAVTAVLGSYCM